MAKISINGFGRIGRNALRALIQKGLKDLELIAINDPFCSIETALHLFKYDSIFGRFKGECSINGDCTADADNISHRFPYYTTNFIVSLFSQEPFYDIVIITIWEELKW